jgi:hypothetical protein
MLHGLRPDRVQQAAHGADLGQLGRGELEARRGRSWQMRYRWFLFG